MIMTVMMISDSLQCYNDKYDFFTLKNTVLHDEKGATGEIVANHQFQFDKPPQKDALYDKGFTIVEKDDYYVLALKGKTKFWNSAIDDKGAFKIYDEKLMKTVNLSSLLF